MSLMTHWFFWDHINNIHVAVQTSSAWCIIETTCVPLCLCRGTWVINVFNNFVSWGGKCTTTPLISNLCVHWPINGMQSESHSSSPKYPRSIIIMVAKLITYHHQQSWRWLPLQWFPASMLAPRSGPGRGWSLLGQCSAVESMHTSL